MVFFITFLRAISAIVITNAHYTGVYPTDLIANGGLLGDVLFFAVSGYCLANVKLSFPRWYLKRIVRIYPPVLIITGIYVLLGFYKCPDAVSAIKLFVYPTYYHFIASILLLYIPFYIVMKTKFLSKRLPLIIMLTFAVAAVIYIFFYDKSNYHIDNVYEYFIRFLFFNAMLLGAYVRQKDFKFRNNSKKFNLFMTIILLPVYFASKLMFAKIPALAPFQIVNQIVLFCLLYFIFITFAGIDNKLERLPGKLIKIISFIGEHTLEIYLVQYMIIPRANVLFFPINWLIITLCIALAAIALRFVSQRVIGLIEKFIKVY